MEYILRSNNWHTISEPTTILSVLFMAKVRAAMRRGKDQEFLGMLK